MHDCRSKRVLACRLDAVDADGFDAFYSGCKKRRILGSADAPGFAFAPHPS